MIVARIIIELSGIQLISYYYIRIQYIKHNMAIEDLASVDRD